MPIFLKAGLWAKKKLGYKGELNLNDLAPAPAYKVLTLTMSHIFPDNLSYKILENTTGGDPLVQQIDEGYYSVGISIAGSLVAMEIPIDKVFAFAGNVGDTGATGNITTSVTPQSFDTSMFQDLAISTTYDSVYSNNILNNTPVEIRIYN